MSIALSREASRGAGLVLFAGLCWSLGGVLVRTVEAAGIWQINFYRSGFVALAVGALLLGRYGSGTLRALRDTGRLGLFCGAMMAGSNLCFIAALATTTVADTMFTMAVRPLIAALLGWTILGERITRATWIAILMAGLGLAIMMGGASGAGRLVGTAIALLGSLFFGGFVIGNRAGRGIDLFPAVALGGVIGALASAVLATGDLEIGTFDLGICMIMGIVQAALGLAAFVAGSRILPAAPLVVLSMIEIPLAPLWVLLAYDEVPSATTLVGGSVILATVVGLALLTARAGKEAKAQ
ncbi:MAG: DMT family transporter [Alphaproteobacteria bacterium]|nr:DMT family transporter [Alphaproteobacteria bacterium]